jgi:hypothetical protein
MWLLALEPTSLASELKSRAKKCAQNSPVREREGSLEISMTHTANVYQFGQQLLHAYYCNMYIMDVILYSCVCGAIFLCVSSSVTTIIL